MKETQNPTTVGNTGHPSGSGTEDVETRGYAAGEASRLETPNVHLGDRYIIPFKKRLVEEQTDLQDKLEKATLFIGTDFFNNLTEEQQYWHRRQVFGMEIYLEALTQRMELLFDEDDWKEVKERCSH